MTIFRHSIELFDGQSARDSSSTIQNEHQFSLFMQRFGHSKRYLYGLTKIIDFYSNLTQLF